MIVNFGPIDRHGGERRLNVIFSRAKHHIVVVSTIDHARITNDYNDGAACLTTVLTRDWLADPAHVIRQLELRATT